MVETTSLSVHRCRFVDYVPSPITALAFPPLPLPRIKETAKFPSNKFGCLAVGRANGNIEICEWSGAEHETQAPQAWVVNRILLGPTPSKVDSLAFAIRQPGLIPHNGVPDIPNLRLFSAGGGNELVEWDLDRLCVMRTLSSQGGAIWSISVNPQSSLLALGCEDGCVRLLSLADNTLIHHRKFDRVKCRLLTIAWGPPLPKQSPKINIDGEASESDDDDDDWSDSWLVTGGSDSSLRKWDVSTGRVLDRMTTDRQRGERTLVWTVAVLGDGTIISGDSLGTVKFWDPRTCTQLQSFQGHGADVLCMVICPDGKSIFSSGVDQKVCLFSHVVVSKSGNDTVSSILRPSGRWVQSTSKRMHSHDVRALAVWPPYSPLATAHQRAFISGVSPILASGGLDMSVVITPCASPASTVSKILNPLATSVASTFEDAYYRRMSYSTGLSPAIHLARQARLLLCTRNRSLSLWRIAKRNEPTESVDVGMDAFDPGSYDKVLDMELKTSTNLLASAISNDGKWLAVSDLYESKLFSMTHEENGLRPKKVKEFGECLAAHLPKSAFTGASALGFSADSSKLVLATASSSFVLVIDLGAGDVRPQVLRKFDQHRSSHAIAGDRAIKNIPGADFEMSDGEEEADDTQRTAVISRMAFSNDGQWLATTDSNCRTQVFNMDAVQHHCIIPSMPQPVQAMSFDPSSPGTLILGLANNKIEIFDVETRRFPEWSRQLCTSVPQRFTHLHDPITGVTFDPTGGQKYALFWGATWLCKVVLDAPVGWGGFSKKRRRESKAPPQAPPPQPAEAGVMGTDMEESNFKVVTRYRPLLFADFLGPGELLVVERPILDILATLPPAYFKPKYGS
ncbi:WD40 repeat-like protein [Rickenella mellea]|uniref:WD40 repeat-like protein n=1 Tax=Rickenella mellea TaxID=50990 RepID=A0A4Y7QM75_9AGAM|nr:WD40 repeat-like protein [Rickenella mellea]